MKSEFMIAITQLAAEKNLPKEVVLQAMEAALVSAYKKDADIQGNVAVKIDRETGDHHVYIERTIVIQIEPAKKVRFDTGRIQSMSPAEFLKFKRSIVIGVRASVVPQPLQ